jgi:hemerythrin
MSVNVRELDAQHQKLVGLVRTLHEAMRNKQGKEALKKIFSGLVAYTATHFATEERLMQQAGYPELEEHRRIHEKMTAKVLALQQEFQQGKVGLTLEVMKFLENWVEKHILGTDKKYGPHLNQQGIY